MKDYRKHSVEYVVEARWSRIGTLTREYVDIAFEYYAAHRIAKERRLPSPPWDEDPTEYQAREQAYERPALKAVVFAGLAVEAAIYEIAAMHLTDKYTKDYLERIDVYTKWVIVPQLICGRPLDSGGPGMNLLDELIKVRNLLVHHKSRPVPSIGGKYDEDLGGVVDYDSEGLKAFQTTLDKVRADGERYVECAEKGVQAIVCLSLELEDLFGVPVPVLGHYGSSYVHSSVERPEPIRQLINVCRKKVADRKAKMKAGGNGTADGQ